LSPRTKIFLELCRPGDRMKNQGIRRRRSHDCFTEGRKVIHQNKDRIHKYLREQLSCPPPFSTRGGFFKSLYRLKLSYLSESTFHSFNNRSVSAFNNIDNKIPPSVRNIEIFQVRKNFAINSSVQIIL